MGQKSSFALIIPCFNEEAAIPDFGEEVREFISRFQAQMSAFELSIIVVNNNSTDRSEELLQGLVKNFNGILRVIPCDVQGYGAALKKGFNSIDADWYGFADLDNTYPILKTIEMLKEADHRNLDIVFANRLKLKSEMPLVRRLGNLFYSYLSNILFADSAHDMCTGMRVFRQRLRSRIVGLQSNDLKFSIEFTAVALKERWRKLEIPITYRYRLGPSKLSVLKDGFLFLFVLLKVRFFRS